MENNDVTLIQQILSGDQDAFTTLVKKYQKQVHAFAWRELGDFHLAEEIAQDTFLNVYQKLYTLKDPNRFAGWLHAIAKNCCYMSFRKLHIPMESLEALPETEAERVFYRHYLDTEREENSNENRHEVVKKLLDKLPENEHTVITLHYLGGMPCKEISEFLGVTLNTIKSRLHRARNRLKEEELMVRETLGGFELPDNMTEDIMQWIQMNEPGVVASVGTLSVTSSKTLYAVVGYKKIYKLPAGDNLWQLVNTDILDQDTNGDIPIAEYDDTLYIIPSDELYASTDDGITWNSIGPCPKGHVKELLITDGPFYLTLNEGVFRSEDKSRSWIKMSDGLEGTLKEKSGIKSLRICQDMLFVGTSLGVYRYGENKWEHLQLPVDATVNVSSLVVSDNKVYVAVAVNLLEGEGYPYENYLELGKEGKQSWWVFCSTDCGNSWTDITPTDVREMMKTLPEIKLLASGDTLLLIGGDEGVVARTIDSGNNWETQESSGITPIQFSVNCSAAIDKSTFYTGGITGIHRSTDGGRTWHRFNTRFECRVDNLISIKTENDYKNPPTLYALVAGTLVKSIDEGVSWESVDIFVKRGVENIPDLGVKTKFREYTPKIVQISKDNGYLYAKVIRRNNETAYYHIAPDEPYFLPLDGFIPDDKMIPSLDTGTLMWHVFGNTTFPFESDRYPGQGLLITSSTHPWSEPDELTKQEILSDPKFGAECFLKRLENIDDDYQLAYGLMLEGLYGNFAVIGETVFMEYNYKLYRWKPGDSWWIDTGVEEIGELRNDNMSHGFKIAASGDKVYVGKRDGQLFQSLDCGTNWTNVTSDLPSTVERYHHVIISDFGVFIATDQGVLCSIDGSNWNLLTDEDGNSVITKSLVEENDTVYGANDEGIYSLDQTKGTWERIVPEIPDTITSLVVDGDTFYVGTEHQGVLRFENTES